ncbi:2468_t:CDS:2, partial [Dentiscutata erythropus]
AYFTILVVEITAEAPTIIQTFASVDKLPVPAILSSFKGSCDKYLTKIQFIDSLNVSVIYFMANDISLMPTGTGFIRISMNSSQYNDFSYYNDGLPFVHTYVTDIESSPIHPVNGQIDQTGLTQLYNSNNISALYTNILMANNQEQIVFFTRRIRNIISPRFKDLLGFAPTLISSSYVDPVIQSVPLPNSNNTGGYTSVLQICPQNYVVNVLTEQRTRTLLSTFGLIGSLWTIAVGIYIFLFGIDKLSPFGCVQSCPCFRSKARKKLKDALEVIPFTSSSKAEQLQDRLNALELFLSERIFDIEYLEDLENVYKQENNDKK